jgi:uncharacterized GH25 family protein
MGQSPALAMNFLFKNNINCGRKEAMKHTGFSKPINAVGQRSKNKKRYGLTRSATKPFKVILSVLLTLCFCFGQIIGLRVLAYGNPYANQNQLLSIGIVNFQDESGTNAPPEFGQKIAQELRGKLIATYKDVLPRMINNAATSSEALTVEQLAALGKQNGVKFMIRGGLLSLNSEGANGGINISVHFYADIIAVDTAAMSSVRAEGSSLQQGDAASPNTDLSAINFASSGFRKTPLGQAFSTAIEQLSGALYQALTSPQDAPQTNTAVNNSPDVNATGGQSPAASIDATKSAETDEDLQQLISQAESLVANSSGIGTDSLAAINQALKNLKTAFDAKARLLEQAQDAASADLEIQTRKQELQTAISTATQQAASSDASTTGGQQNVNQPVSGEKKNLMASINGYLGDALGMMQKIQEMRSLLRSGNEGSSYNPGNADSGNPPYPSNTGNSPVEEPTTEVNGVVTDAGSPVEGATVTDPETGATATTGSNGSYNLRGVAAGRLAQLIIAKSGKQIGAGQLDLVKGRPAVADFDVKPQANGNAASALRIIPATVLVNALKVQGQNTGVLKGQIRDPQGQPVTRALVSLKGIAVARTDSQGLYTFLNVPAGTHQLTIQKSGLVLKSQQVQVLAKKSNESQLQFSAAEKLNKEPVKTSIIARGEGTTLRGRILDNDKAPLAGAKITALLSNSAVAVFANEKGKFEFQDLKAGQYRILVSKPGFDSNSRIVELGVGKSESFEAQLKPASSQVAIKVIQAQRARANTAINQSNSSVNQPPAVSHPQEVAKGQLSGRIVDAQTGKPIQGAIISVQGQTPARTDAGGIYVLPNLSQGNYRIAIAKAGFVEIAKTTTIRAGNTTREDFSLKQERKPDERIDAGNIRVQPNTPVRTGQLRGQILDAKSGRPLAGASILIANQQAATTNQDGMFAIANLQAGNYQLVVKRSGYADASGTISIRPGEVSSTSLRLSPRTALILPPRR